MDPILIATISGIVVAFLWGTNDWLSARSAKKFLPTEINFVIAFTGTLIALAIVLITDVKVPDPRQFAILSVAYLLITIAYLVFVRALKSGAVGIVAPIGNGYGLVTLILSAVFLGVSFTGPQVLAIAGIILGATLLAYEKNHKKIPLKELHKDTILAVTAALVWGVAFFILGFIIDELAWQSVFVFAQFIDLFLATILLYVAVRKKLFKSMRKALANRTVVLTGLTACTGALVLYLGADYAKSIVIPSIIASCAPLVASGWGAAVDKERLGVVRRAGAVIVVAGILILNASH